MPVLDNINIDGHTRNRRKIRCREQALCSVRSDVIAEDVERKFFRAVVY